MKNISILALAAGLLTLGSISCEPEYDVPPIEAIPEGKLINIDTLENWFANGGSQSITEDYSLYAVITTDESTGNFYKEAYAQDNSRGIRIRFSSSSSLSIGDSVRIYLKGTYLDEYNGLLQLDSVDPDDNIIIQANNVDIEPLTLNLLNVTGAYQSQLVKIENVEFAASSLGETWADEANQFAKNLDLTDCSGNTVLVRTSGYANFAGAVVPEGSGTFIGVVGVFGTDIQLYVRTPDELILTGTRCTGGGTVTCNPSNSVLESFSSFAVASAVSDMCWSTQSDGTAPQWTIGDISGNKLAVGSWTGTSSTAAQTSWLISPELVYSSSQVLSFKSAVQSWSHDGLECYILTNYSGNVNTATQTLVTGATFAGNGSGDDILVSSGNIPLNTFGISGNYRVAFKYSFNPGASQLSKFKVDDVSVL